MKLSDITSLVFEITSHCNIKCPQCSRTDWDGSLAKFIELKHWNVDTIIPNLQLDQLSNLSFIRIEGDNGDALMHPNIERILDALYDLPNSPDVLILTNGSMRNTDWWYKIGSKYKNKLVVQFSIDGLEDTNHLYRVGSDYNKVIANAKAFISGGGTASQRCLIFQHNKHQLDKIFSTAKDIGFQQLIVKSGDEFRFQGWPQWQVWDKGHKSHIIYPISAIDNIDFNPYNYNTLPRKNYQRMNNLICPIMKGGEITITYKGHLIPCCVYHADLYFDHPDNDAYRELVGDVNKIDLNIRSLGEILNDPEYYGHRLESSLKSNNRLAKCHSVCSRKIDKI